MNYRIRSFLNLLDISGVQILSGIFRLRVISLSRKSSFLDFRNAATVSLEIACNRFLCFLVKGSADTFPDLVCDSGSVFLLKVFVLSFCIC